MLLYNAKTTDKENLKLTGKPVVDHFANKLFDLINLLKFVLGVLILIPRANLFKDISIINSPINWRINVPIILVMLNSLIIVSIHPWFTLILVTNLVKDRYKIILLHSRAMERFQWIVTGTFSLFGSIENQITPKRIRLA